MLDLGLADSTNYHLPFFGICCFKFSIFVVRAFSLRLTLILGDRVEPTEHTSYTPVPCTPHAHLQGVGKGVGTDSVGRRTR